MRAVGAVIMAAAVALILTSPDLSGATLFGALVFLFGLWVAQMDTPRPPRPRDSTAAAVDDAAQELTR